MTTELATNYVNVSDTPEYLECRFRVPVVLTASVYRECVELTPKAVEAGNDLAGRLWDVLYLCSVFAKRNPGKAAFGYSLRVIQNRCSHSVVWLRVEPRTVDGVEVLVIETCKEFDARMKMAA